MRFNLAKPKGIIHMLNSGYTVMMFRHLDGKIRYVCEDSRMRRFLQRLVAGKYHQEIENKT